MNLTNIYGDVGSIPGLVQWVRIWHCCELCVGHKWGSDLVLLWLWFRPAAAAWIHPLAWELPYVRGVAIKKQKKNINLIHERTSLKISTYEFGVDTVFRS